MRPLVALLLVAAAGRADPPRLTPTLDAGGHTGRVWKVAFTPDGKQLVSVSFDKSVRVWDVATGQPVRTLYPPAGPGEAGMVIALCVSPDGKRAAVAGVGPDPQEGSHPVYLLDLAAGRVEKVLRGPTSIVNFVAFSADGTRLAAGSHDKAAYVWDEAGQLAHVLRGHGGMIECLAFAPDGRLLTTAHDKTARVWAADGKLLADWQAHDRPVSAAAWSPDGAVLATGSQDGSVRLWGPGGKAVRTVAGATLGNVTALAFTADSRGLLFTGWSNDQAKARVKGLIDVATGRISREARTDISLTDGAISPDGSLTAVATVQGDIVFMAAADGRVVRRLAATGARTPYTVGWLPDGRGPAWGFQFAASTADRAVLPLDRGFDLAAAERVNAPPAGCARPELTRGNRRLTWNAAAEAVELRHGEAVAHTLTPKRTADVADNVSGFAWWGDDRIAVGGAAAVYLFDPATGQQVRKLSGHTDIVTGLAASRDGRFLATVSNDRTVRVWTADRDDPLVSVFAAGNDWLAWTPEGYYAASPGGERLMGWRVENGPAALSTFHPAARFRDSLYRPDVLKLLLKHGSVEAALKAADAAPPPKGKLAAAKEAAAKLAGKLKPGGHHEPASVADVLPPLVVITSPDQPKVDSKDPTLSVRFLARPVGKQPLTAVRLMIDGRPYPGTEGVKTFDPPKAGEVRETWTVKLPPGTHTFAVAAETAASKAVSEPVEVTFAARGLDRDPADAGRKEELQKPALYVLAVGVSAYQDEKLKLNVAAKDAEAIAAALTAGGKGLYRTVEVKVLTDKQATRRNILQGLTWLRKQMTQNDVGVISFAGHGDKDADGTFYLLPADVDTADLLSTAVPGDLVKRTLAGMPGKFVVLLDACHSGGIDGEKRRASGSPTDDLVRDLATDEYGVVVLCSSTGREFSLESLEAGHGYFTQAVVEGLAGKGPKTADGAVYLHHLDGYVTDRVKGLTAGRQHPVSSKPSSLRSFPLSKP